MSVLLLFREALNKHSTQKGTATERWEDLCEQAGSINCLNNCVCLSKPWWFLGLDLLAFPFLPFTSSNRRIILQCIILFEQISLHRLSTQLSPIHTHMQTQTHKHTSLEMLTFWNFKTHIYRTWSHSYLSHDPEIQDPNQNSSSSPIMPECTVLIEVKLVKLRIETQNGWRVKHRECSWTMAGRSYSLVCKP